METRGQIDNVDRFDWLWSKGSEWWRLGWIGKRDADDAGGLGGFRLGNLNCTGHPRGSFHEGLLFAEKKNLFSSFEIFSLADFFVVFL